MGRNNTTTTTKPNSDASPVKISPGKKNSYVSFTRGGKIKKTFF